MRRTPYPRHPTVQEVPRIPTEEVTLLWYHHYYDGPLDGEAAWKGQRYWYRAIFEYRSDDYDGVYELIKLPASEWAVIDRHQEIAREYLGTGHVFGPDGKVREDNSVVPDWEAYINHPEIKDSGIESYIPQGRLIGTFRLWGEEPAPKVRKPRKKSRGNNA